jgi:hypothetical protein
MNSKTEKESNNNETAQCNINSISKCFICGTEVTDKEKLDNMFEIACKQHEGLGELSTKFFFKKSPDYTKW